jgi:hypothetical protein
MLENPVHGLTYPLVFDMMKPAMMTERLRWLPDPPVRLLPEFSLPAAMFGLHPQSSQEFDHARKVNGWSRCFIQNRWR